MTYLSNTTIDPFDLGYFADPAALSVAYPVGIDGAFAVVGSTDTIWVWDSTTNTWVNTNTGGSGTGDMVLASVQTNSGLKTFLNATLGLRNVANTITSLLANAATVARTWTFPDKDGTVAMTSDITGTNSGTNTGDNATNSQYSGLATSKLSLDQTTPQTVINGKPIFSDGIKFGATPTVGSFANGKMYYDVNYKTMAVNIADDVTLQIGQEAHTLVNNSTGVDIPNGSVVYINGASAGVPTIALAKADAHATAEVAGVTTQLIANGTTGLITNRGEIHNVDTSTFTVGDDIYLSGTTAGAFTNTAPVAGNIKVRLGNVLEVNATTGEIFVSVIPELGLGDLSNVVTTNPVLDDTLRFNGTEWVNGTSTVSAGTGIEFYNASPTITASSTNNSLPIVTLSKTPVTTTEQTITGTANTNTVAFSSWLYNTALGRTTIDAGTWDFSTYAAVNSVAGGRVTTLTRNIFCARPLDTGTVATTGTGTSRTATASSGTPFALTEITASATNTDASYLQTPQGLYQITARTSDTVVTILVPTTYTNESAVAGTVWKKLFGITTPTITSTGTNYALYTTKSVQPAFTIVATCKLGSVSFVTSNNTTTVTVTYNGTTHNSNFSTPLITLHNNLAGLQGGTSNEFYHMTSAQATVVGNTSGTNTGDNATNSQYSGLAASKQDVDTKLTAIASLANTSGALINDGAGNFSYAITGIGDMLLVSIQTVTGAKTFNNAKLYLRNVADTFSGVFSNTITAARTWTFPDKDGTVAMTSDITGTNSGTNTGDQTSIVGITGTMAQFDTAVSDGNIFYQSGAGGTPSSLNLTNATGLPAASVVAGVLGVTGTRMTKLWATDIESTNAPTVGGVAVPTISSTNTMSGKRYTARAYNTTSTATLTPEIDTYDDFELTAQAANITIANHSTSTPTQGEVIFIQITPDATPRTITFGTNYVAKAGVALPTTTVASKSISMLFRWSAGLSKYVLLAAGQE